MNKKDGMNYALEKIIPRRLLLIAAGVLLWIIGKDLLHATVRGYSFYLSDSLLFGVFWLLFIPLIWWCVQNATRFSPLLGVAILGTVHLLGFAGVVSLVSIWCFESPFGFTRILVDSIADYGLICLATYGGVSHFARREQVMSEIKNKNTSHKIRVTHRGSYLFLDTADILYVATERPYLALITEHGRFLYASSLRTFQETHLDRGFVRIHKSTIVQTDSIASFRSRQNGDYDVIMRNGNTVRASRNYNSFFAQATGQT